MSAIPLRSLAGCVVVVGLLPGAASARQTQEVTAATIDGPSAPVAPSVMARDATGRITMRATQIDQPLRIDGVLDDGPYQSVQSISDFIQQEPNEGQPASEKTEVWILADRDHLYIGVRCHDSQASRIVANDMRRDGRNIGQNDNLSIVIDSFYDRRNGYEFLVNAVGGMADAQITDERDVNRDWNTVWQYRAKRDAGGWTAEMAFPFRSLRYRPGATQVWGLNIRRTIRWKNEFVVPEPGAADAGRARDPEAVVGGHAGGAGSAAQGPEPGHQALRARSRQGRPRRGPDLRGRSGRRRRRGREVRHHARA